MFSNRLKELRQEKGLIQERFAQELNVSKGAVAMWETGKRIPDSEMLKAIAKFFSVSVDYLLGESKYRNSEEVIKYNEDCAKWNISDPYFEAAFDFANLLAPIREEQGVSLSELGSIIGASERQMQDIEDGVLPITYEQAEKLCGHLGTNVSQVLFDNQLYNDDVPEEYHDNVKAWEHKKKELEKETEANVDDLHEGVLNPDILMIARAGEKMTPEQAENLRKYAQYMFPEAFKND